MLLALSGAVAAQDDAWTGPYGGISLRLGRPAAGVFLGAMTDRGGAVMGLELGAGLGRGEDEVALTGRLGRGLGDTLLYGLAGLGSAPDGDVVVLGAGASRRLGGLRLGGELRRSVGEGDADAETRLGGRIALEF